MDKYIVMNREEILRRQNGLRVSINVELVQDHQERRGIYKYSVCITTCEKGRRKWQPVYDDNHHEFRALPFGSEAREQYISKKQLEVVTLAEVYGVMLALWEKMKP